MFYNNNMSIYTQRLLSEKRAERFGKKIKPYKDIFYTTLLVLGTWYLSWEFVVPVWGSIFNHLIK